MPPPVLDNFGRPIGDTAPDQWLARCGIATAIGSISPHLSKTQILPLFRFFVDKGLGDRSEEVGRQMLAAAVASLNEHGKVGLFPLCVHETTCCNMNQKLQFVIIKIVLFFLLFFIIRIIKIVVSEEP